MQVVTVSTEPRTETGKKASSALRKEGKIPAVVYSVNGVEAFTTTHKSVKPLVYTPDFKVAELEINGTVKRALIKDIDFHPVTDEIMHMDFIELVDNHPVKASLPVKFRGQSPGVKSGGKLIPNLRTVKVKTTPKNLVDSLYVDISSLELGQSVRVRDIETPEGITLDVDGATPVAIVEIPRALRSAATAAAKEEAGAAE